ncbi:AEC family transporter [Paenibacillus macerans]|uniref:AEC family transporter n=1 Tax=Paenibacillus macerans TaxID=44252 RepID=UPI003D31ACE0
MLLFDIFAKVVIPLFLLICGGTVLHRKFKLDLHTLAKLNIAYLLPATIFIKLYSADISPGLFKEIVLFFVVCMLALYLVCKLSSKILRHNRGMTVAFTNSVLFDNSGNYAIPLNQLVFGGNPLALSIQVLIMSFQSFLTFSYGVIALQSLDAKRWKALLGYFKMPVFYALVLGLLFNAIGIRLPDMIFRPLEYVSNALVAIALLTLGAQIANLRMQSIRFPVMLSLVLRLLISPAIALMVIALFELDGLAAQTLLVSSGMPSSVNSAILAQEYDNESEFASQAVLFSTLLNAFTITGLIALSRVLY